MKGKLTLLIVANERDARILKNAGTGKGLTEVTSLTRSEETRYADAPGRSQSGPGSARHGFDRSSTERDQDRDGFAGQVIDVVQSTWSSGQFDRLVIAAPPKMLGVIRGRLNDALSEALAGDLNKDLVQVPTRDLPTHFNHMIVF